MALLRRRGYSAAVPSACCFLLLLLVLSASHLLPTRRGHGGVLEGLALRGSASRSRSGSSSSSSAGEEQGSCQELQSIEGGEARCLYLRTHPPCAPAGYVDYLRLFYCGFAHAPAAGYAAAVLWLAVLFYLLGDTASEYFCASLEGLSAELRLPPAIAGVTLLSLGNGAPDVFASVVSFAAGDGGASGSTARSVARCSCPPLLLGWSRSPPPRVPAEAGLWWSCGDSCATSASSSSRSAHSSPYW